MKKKNAAPRLGRPPGPKKPKPYTTVIRLPPALGKKLQKAADKNGVSINAAIVNLVTVWLDSEAD